jgi:tetratricopeptide (TPR) repeat protein
MGKRCFEILLIVTSLTFAIPSRAQGVDYTAVFEQGLAAYEAGNFVAATQSWERLLATVGDERAYKVGYNLGLAYEKLGDATRAVERLQVFADRAASEPNREAALEERRQDALERIRAIKATHGALAVAPAPPGQVVLVRVGSAEPRPAGFTVYLAPGPHEIELNAGTTRASKRRVELVAGKVTEIALDTPKPSTPSAPPPPPRATRSFPTAWLVGGAIATAASFALPIGFAFDTKSKRDSAGAISTSDPRYPVAVGDFEDARTRYEVSYILPAALAVATAVVVVVIMKLPSDSSDRAKGPRWLRGTF